MSYLDKLASTDREVRALCSVPESLLCEVASPVTGVHGRCPRCPPLELAQAYAAFVANSLAACCPGGAPVREVQPDAGLCASTVVTRLSATATLTTSEPATLARVGDRIYINMCTHACIVPPTTSDGCAAPTAQAARGSLPLPTLLSLSIPIAVGPLRRVAGDGAAWASDVVLHPWVLTAARGAPQFLRELLAFAARCVGDERGLVLADSPPQLAEVRGTAYVDGCPFAAPRGDLTAADASNATPWPFDVSRLPPFPAASPSPPRGPGRTTQRLTWNQPAGHVLLPSISAPTPCSDNGSVGDSRGSGGARGALPSLAPNGQTTSPLRLPRQPSGLPCDPAAKAAAAAPPGGARLAHSSPAAVLHEVEADRRRAGVGPSASVRGGGSCAAGSGIGLTPAAATQHGVAWEMTTVAPGDGCGGAPRYELVVSLPAAAVRAADLRDVGVEVGADVAVVVLPSGRSAAAAARIVVPWPTSVDADSAVARRRGRTLTVMVSVQT